VPHQQNLSYFGNGHDEAQMIYNFALPPLVLHTFYTENSEILSDWADSLEFKSRTTTFFNFLDSHDGIGLSAVKNILSLEQINFIIKNVQERQGYISYKMSSSGQEEPYELNITWFNALNYEDDFEEPVAEQVKRFVASRSIALVLQGVPGIYLHGLFGTSNDLLLVSETNSKRDINRRVLFYEAIVKSLEDPHSRPALINQELGKLIKIRIKQAAFHPNSYQKILKISSKVFAVLRTPTLREGVVLAITNICNGNVSLDIPFELIKSYFWVDLFSKSNYKVDQGFLSINLEPYEVLWLKSLDVN